MEHRLALRERPERRPIMRQRWSRLLFLHWRVAPELLRPTLPRGLRLDLHDGHAWLGIVPFFMERVRPLGGIPIPGVSWFLELNVRTYVHDENGIPGVWFHSLDCNQPLAVRIARRFFYLNYLDASMSARIRDRRIRYRCRRQGEGNRAEYEYGPAAGEATHAAPGTLEFFLTERYLLYSNSPDGSLLSGRVHHTPYRLREADCPVWSAEPARWNGMTPPDGPPDSALYAEPVNVSCFPLQPHARVVRNTHQNTPAGLSMGLPVSGA